MKFIKLQRKQPLRTNPTGNEVTDVEMVDQEVVPPLESSDSHMEVSTEDQPPLASGGGLVSPEEDAILMGATS